MRWPVQGWRPLQPAGKRVHGLYPFHHSTNTGLLLFVFCCSSGRSLGAAGGAGGVRFASSGLHHFGEQHLSIEGPRAAAASSAGRGQPGTHRHKHASGHGGDRPHKGKHPQSGSGSGGVASVAASAPRPSRVHVNYGIGADNVGFRLLKQAGWREGSGLGAQQQGRVEPLQAHANKGARGLGFAHERPQEGGPGSGGAAAGHTAKRQRTSGGEEAVAGEGKLAGPQLGGARVAALVASELASEDLDTKLKRHRQLAK